MKQIYFFSTILLFITGNSANSQVYINEMYYANSSTNQYIEFRGTPSSTIDSGTYFAILGAYDTVAGRLFYLFDLSGMTFGSNGYLVLLQSGNSYSPDSESSVVTATGSGFGNLTSGSLKTFNNLFSYSALLINTGTPPIANTDYDSNDDGVLQGAATSWNIIDAISYSNSVQDPDINSIYGEGAYFIYNGPGAGPTNYTAGTVNSIGVLNPKYISRIGESTGNTVSDWLIGSTSGTIPSMVMSSLVSPSSYSGENIDTLGSMNLDQSLSLENPLDITSLNIVPNPSGTGEFLLKFNKEDAYSVNIFDALGKLIK